MQTTKTIEDFKANLHENGPIIFEDMLKAQTGNFLIDRAANTLLNVPKFESVEESLYQLDSDTIECLEWVVQKLVDKDDTLANEEWYEESLKSTFESLSKLISYVVFNESPVSEYAIRQQILDVISDFDTPNNQFLLNGRDFNDKSYIGLHLNGRTGKKTYRLRISHEEYLSKQNIERKIRMPYLVNSSLYKKRL